MNSLYRTLLVSAVMAAPLGAQSEPVTAFVGVSVIPMDRERVLADQTVIVRGDQIAEVGPASSVRVPSGATRVDGRGKYLMPGLAEMHAHIPPGAQVADSTIERVLALYALHGVTTIRGMLGHPRHLAFRERVARGDILSPTIVTAGPSLNGNSVPTPEAAIAAVTEQQAAGYDLLKIHPGIRREVFDSLAAAADRVGIRFSGHVPLDVGLERALAARYETIDHIDGFVEALVPPGEAAPESQFFGINLIDRVDRARLSGLIARTRQAGTWIVPTQSLFEHLLGDYPLEILAARPEMRWVSANAVEQWRQQTAGIRSGGASASQRAGYLELRRTMIRELHKAGVPLLLGSDAPQVWNVPGYSVRRELAFLVEAGLTPFEALATGTSNVGRFLGAKGSAGTVEPGKRADLLLLEANPLERIENVGAQAGVMIRGRWLSKADVEQQLTKLARD